MIIICGKTIAEVERDLEMAKQAIASGMPYGVGGATIEDVEQAMRGLLSAVGESNPPISNPNYTAPCGRCCDCDCDPAYDDECEDCECGCAEDDCPCCGAPYPAYNGEHCDDCGYGYEDEEEEDEIVPPAVAALVEMLRYLGADEDTINKLLS